MTVDKYRRGSERIYMLDWKSFPDTGILENVLFLAIISPYQKECHVLTYVQYQIHAN